MVWKPRVTVAMVAERDGRYLMVEEHAAGGIRFNQPAGHLEDGESVLQAAVRECLEETAWQVRPEALVGIYRWRNPRDAETYLRVTFCGQCLSHDPDRPLDPDIVAVHWLSAAQIRAREQQLRSPLVLRSLNDFLTGKRVSLDLLVDLP